MDQASTSGHVPMHESLIVDLWRQYTKLYGAPVHKSHHKEWVELWARSVELIPTIKKVLELND